MEAPELSIAASLHLKAYIAHGCLSAVNDSIKEPGHKRNKRVCNQLQEELRKLSGRLPRIKKNEVKNLETYMQASNVIIAKLMKAFEDNQKQMLLNLVYYILTDVPSIRPSFWNKLREMFSFWDGLKIVTDPTAGHDFAKQVDAEAAKLFVQTKGVIL